MPGWLIAPRPYVRPHEPITLRGGVLRHTIENGATLTRIWSTSFDRARTTRNTLAVRGVGAGVGGTKVDSTTGSHDDERRRVHSYTHSRTQPQQFHKGVSLLGLDIPVTDETVSVVWKDMLKHRSRRRLASSSLSASSTLATPPASEGMFSRGTISVEGR